jgi:hypothetical protein
MRPGTLQNTFHITTHLFADRPNLVRILNKEISDLKAITDLPYLGKTFHINEEDFEKRLITVTFYFGPSKEDKRVHVHIRGGEASLPMLIGAAIGMNRYEQYDEPYIGYTADDFVQDKYTARLYFDLSKPIRVTLLP